MKIPELCCSVTAPLSALIRKKIRDGQCGGSLCQRWFEENPIEPCCKRVDPAPRHDPRRVQD